MSQAAPTFYVLHGPDEFTRRAYVDAMRAQMGDPATAELNITVLDGKQATAADVLSSARSMPFLSDRRMVIINGMITWLTRKGAGTANKEELDKLIEGLTQLPHWARVVFVETSSLSDRNALLKLAKTAPGGFHKEFDPPRNAVRWIVEQARAEYDTEIDPGAARALAEVINNDLRTADSELAKLALYVNGERAITEADIALLTPYVSEANVFEMVDAIGRRDGKIALRLMHRLLEDGEPLQLFGMIIRQFRLLIQAREYLNAGGNPKGLGKAIGVHPFVGEKLGMQVRAFSLEQLEKIYHFLLETDMAIKTGRVRDRLALDLLIASIAQ